MRPPAEECGTGHVMGSVRDELIELSRLSMVVTVTGNFSLCALMGVLLYFLSGFLCAHRLDFLWTTMDKHQGERNGAR
jgi:hypothetical protein